MCWQRPAPGPQALNLAPCRLMPPRVAPTAGDARQPGVCGEHQHAKCSGEGSLHAPEAEGGMGSQAGQRWRRPKYLRVITN